MAAIRSAAQDPEKQAIADALAAAVAKQEGREQVMAGRHKEAELEAAHAREQESVVSSLRAELVALRATDPGISMLEAVEYGICNRSSNSSPYPLSALWPR
jgi:hypothetical protein